MSKEVFLTNEEEQEIVAAISMAEKETSGEIRVHIEKTEYFFYIKPLSFRNFV